ncbi:GNAT family N-acetyltransferase [Streptomyces sp. URMC 123]|uniref:GNAT family N-acetyltransferase n=1 Tax=Streptomyces sp. URMC 123 TaxID=3423403 RepID=UPI003F1D6121
MAPEWDALYRRCATATPFQTHAWLHSWWLSYGTRGRLRLLLAHRAGALVGVAPLTLVHRPLPTLVPLGGDISDFFDVLLSDECPDEAAGALARGLARAARTALVDLREVRPGAALERVYARWPGPRRTLPDSVCLELPAAPIEELLQRIPNPGRRRTRGKLRRLDALGIEHRSVPEDEVPEAVARLLRLHGMQWRGRGMTPEHLRPRFAEHLVRATRAMVRTGDAVLTEYRQGGRVLAADVTLKSADLLGGYLFGAHPELRAQADITAMLMRHDAEHAARAGHRVVSMLRGVEPYKRHWRPDTVTNRRFLLARRGLGGPLRLYAAGVAGRAALAATARRRLPFLLAVRTRLHAWRSARAGGR